MTADQIIEKIGGLQRKLFIVKDGQPTPAQPSVLASNLLLIRALLVELTPIIAAGDREYRLTRAAKYDELLKAGEKKSPAADATKLTPEIIELETEVERIRGYYKAVDGLCTGIQSVLKQQSDEAKNLT